MSKKAYHTRHLENELAGASLFFQPKKTPPPSGKATSKLTPNATSGRKGSRARSREKPRQLSDAPVPLPSRNEIQEFSFKLRDELKVKVQAEVPPAWQKELDNLAHDLGVKKLELYRFILGEFLGKVQRKSSH